MPAPTKTERATADRDASYADLLTIEATGTAAQIQTARETKLAEAWDAIEVLGQLNTSDGRTAGLVWKPYKDMLLRKLGMGAWTTPNQPRSWAEQAWQG